MNNKNNFSEFLQNEMYNNLTYLRKKLMINFKNSLSNNEKILKNFLNVKLLELTQILRSNEYRNKYFKDQKIINKCLKDQLIKNSTNQIVEIEKKSNKKVSNIQSLSSKIKNLNGFNLINVPGDGTCLYHSIIISMQIMNINILEKINNLNLKNIKINKNVKLDGFFLREVLVKYLENIPDKYLEENMNKLIMSLNEESQLERINLYNSIQSSELLLNSKYFNKNGKELGIPLKNKINKLKEKIKDTKIWGSEEDLIFISFILKICIFVYDNGSKRKVWKKYNYNSVDKCDPQNSIFIIYNGENHYDSLKPENINVVNNILLEMN